MLRLPFDGSPSQRETPGALLLDSRDGMRKGGDTGPAVVPGDLEKSLIVKALRHQELEMPPKGKLSDSIIADFEKWIIAGAEDPRTSPSKVLPRSIDWEQGRLHWSFQRLSHQVAPPRGTTKPSTTDRCFSSPSTAREACGSQQGCRSSNADSKSLVRFARSPSIASGGRCLDRSASKFARNSSGDQQGWGIDIARRMGTHDRLLAIESSLRRAMGSALDGCRTLCRIARLRAGL